MPNTVNTIPKQPNWTVISLIALTVAFVFFQPFMGAICFAALMAYLLSSTHRKLSKHIPEKMSAPVLLICSFIIMFLPVAFIVVLAVTQAINFAEFLSSLNPSTNDKVANAVESINGILAPLGHSAKINMDTVTQVVQNTIPHVITKITEGVMGFISNLPQLFTSIIIYSFLFTAFLRYGKPAQNFIKSLSPFEEDLSEKYIRKSGLIVSASLKGQFVISFVTAISSALLLFVLDLQNYFWFFVILFTILGMIPLGSGIVMIPLSIAAMIFGDFWPGFWVLLIYLVFICNIDTFLRPRLIPKKANIIPALTTLATFCGLYYFGILGVVYGPLIIILLTTTADIYISTHQQPAKVKA